MGTQSAAFRFESEMQKTVVPELASVLNLNHGPVTCISTPMIGNIIPDVLIGCWLGPPNTNLKNLSYVDAAIFALLERDGELAERDLLSRIYLAPPAASKTLAKLHRIGAIEKTETGAFRVATSMATHWLNIVAVELKMKRWREALQQALTYGNFADEAYVVLDRNQVRFDEQMEKTFQAAGVGLLLHDGLRMHRVVDASANRRFTSDRVIAAQKLTRFLQPIGPSMFSIAEMPSAR